MRYLFLSLLSAFALSAVSNVVFAHTKMVTSVPANGSHVAAGLSQLEFTFSKSMRLTVVKVKDVHAEADIAPTEDLPVDFLKTATVRIPPLKAGSYTVDWTAVGTDGHVMNGTIAFVVDREADTISEQP